MKCDINISYVLSVNTTRTIGNGDYMHDVVYIDATTQPPNKKKRGNLQLHLFSQNLATYLILQSKNKATHTPTHPPSNSSISYL